MNEQRLHRVYQQIELLTSMLTDTDGDEAVQLQHQLAGLHAQAAELEAAAIGPIPAGNSRLPSPVSPPPTRPLQGHPLAGTHDGPEPSDDRGRHKASGFAAWTLAAGALAIVLHRIGLFAIFAVLLNFIALARHQSEQAGRWRSEAGLVLSFGALLLYLAYYGHI